MTHNNLKFMPAFNDDTVLRMSVSLPISTTWAAISSEEGAIGKECDVDGDGGVRSESREAVVAEQR